MVVMMPVTGSTRRMRLLNASAMESRPAASVATPSGQREAGRRGRSAVAAEAEAVEARARVEREQAGGQVHFAHPVVVDVAEVERVAGAVHRDGQRRSPMSASVAGPPLRVESPMLPLPATVVMMPVTGSTARMRKLPLSTK